MAGVSLHIDMAEVTERLGEITSRLGNLQPLMERIGAVLLLSSQMRIEQTKKAPDGSAWTPWAKSTAKRRLKNGSAGGGLLRFQGHLLRSLNYRASADSVTVSMGGSGKAMDYARIQQLGGDIQRGPSSRNLYYGTTGNQLVKKKKAKRVKTVNVGGYVIHIPARPVLGLSDDDVSDIREVVNDYLVVE
ncbi:MAG: phage virion morphogenesis protein [Deltaproteobacteria bacterium]|jgi:phage virion morphogenesis protein|nr:phage virion morphogenesis protein [Deltaproteobacteria bacterium]